MKWLVGRQEIADYARVSTWTVTAMCKGGMRHAGGGKGRELRTKEEWVDDFIIENPDFVARNNMARCREI